MMNFYFIFILFLKIYIAHKLIRGNTFYFVFWRASVFFYSLLSIAALSANIIWSRQIFNYDISNFLIPFLDLLYFLIFAGVFIFLLGKYVPSVSDKYFSLLINTLFFTSISYSSLNLYFTFNGEVVSILDLLFPFGALVKYVWVLGPLFGAYHYSKLNQKHKFLLLTSSLLLFFIIISNGRRSLLLFLTFFFTFWCWRTTILKKLAFILILGITYSSFHSYHIAFKHFSSEYFTHKGVQLSLNEKIMRINEFDQMDTEYIDHAIKRTLHKYILTEPVFRELEKMEGVGLKPLKTAIYAPIPSKFLETKPYPGSLDGDHRTSFAYLVNKIAFGAGWNMSEYPISLEFIWYGDIKYVVLSMFSSIFLMVLLYRASIYFKDRFVILPVVTTYPGDYYYFQPTLIKLIEMFSYVYLPGITVVISFILLRELCPKDYKHHQKLTTKVVIK